MSIRSFENFGLTSQIPTITNTEIAGRYSFQEKAEKWIIHDVQKKLDLNPEDTLLDIGCGPGNLLIPLSFSVQSVTGIDNIEVINKLERRVLLTSKFRLEPGDFLSISLPEKNYSKILIYSVVQYLESFKELEQFLRKALQLLSPGGKLLLGDLPNIDKKKRFLSTVVGQEQHKQWMKMIAGASHPSESLTPDINCIQINDQAISNILINGRDMGFESYLVQQPAHLPFGNTREDIVFIAPD